MQKFRLQIISVADAMATGSSLTNLKLLHERKCFKVFLFQFSNNNSLHINLRSHGFKVVVLKKASVTH
jgi:hypothetical protein